MEHAWLDSLSEDWLSQPSSDNSDPQLPPAKSVEKPKARDSPSRMPRRANSGVSSVPALDENNTSALSERSANDINMSWRRMPSKLSQEVKPTQGLDNSLGSGSSNGSVVHNTVQHQLSPENKADTPEWKRRLVDGNLDYGEQRDLFCSAANGLQDMFRPPAEHPTIPEEDEPEDEPEHESTMPSSPPIFSRRRISAELEHEVSTLEEADEEPHNPNDVTPSPSPRRAQREVKYKLNVEDFSVLDTPSNMPASRPVAPNPEDVEIYRDESCLSAASHAGNVTRKTSGQSDTKNEDFSPILIGKQSKDGGKVDFGLLDFPADQLQQRLERLRINQALWDSQADIQEAFDEEGEGSRDLDTSAEFARQGGYINFRRGGRSEEGSFRHHLPSPHFGVDTSEMLPEESLQASTPKQFPSVRMPVSSPQGDPPSPSLPRAPFPSPDKQQAVAGDQSSGSPLKLFGQYDSFTKQMLLRRISQFEDGVSGTSSGESVPPRKEHTGQGVAADSSPVPRQRSTSRSFSEFGGGDLKGYEFNGDLSCSADESGLSGKENISPQLRPHLIFPPRGLSPDEESEVVVRRRREKSRSMSGQGTPQLPSQPTQHGRLAPSPPFVGSMPKYEYDLGSEGKRPRTSPSKDPTPKRRRTLHRSDIAFGRENLAGIDYASHQVQSIMKKKRRDSRPGGFDVAEPQVLASRSMLHPRTASGKLKQGGLYTDDDEDAIVDEQRKTSPGEDNFMDGERKPSIRTQDFVDQAAQIMAMIRNQVQPPGLASVDESGVESYQISPGLSNDFGSDSTREPFSRPPSREGKPSVSRSPLRQDDPALADRLRKYQEVSDLGDVISSSMRSIKLPKHGVNSTQNGAYQGGVRRASHTDPVDDGEVISDIPNVRISSNPDGPGFSPSPSRDYPSNGSGQSTNRSYPTGSSRGSDSKRIIMPESVSHLIPERVGSMCLDKGTNVWIKNKEPRPAQTPTVPQSDSDEDPFASIPDLSVDLTKEMQNLRLVSAKKENSHVSPEQRGPEKSPSEAKRPSFSTASPVQSRPAEVPTMSPGADSKAGMGSSLGSQGGAMGIPTPRNATISFSSPVASVIQDNRPSNLDGSEDGSQEYSPEPAVVPGYTGKSALKNGAGAGVQARYGRTGFIPRPVSRIDEQDEDSTVELPHHENNQLSIVGETSLMSHRTPNARRASVSFLWNATPGNGALSVRGDDSSMIGQNVGKLSLSPLSEFTLHNAEAPCGFEVSYVMGHRHMETGDGSKRVMSMTIRNLVDRLGEAEPYEPYWEDLTELDLQDKRLSSLHMLDEFCDKVVTLDASKNALGHLDGVPQSVRQLKVSQNMLTELTSWDHLHNLQYVDVSGNELTSLSALRSLVHLRSIKADKNRLTSLDGLDCHDGLLTVRARDNLIEDVDFARLQLDRVTELDLAGNQISSVRGLELLPQLARLKLSRNRLQELTTRGVVKALRHLDVSDNDLELLDVSGLPGLHSVHADRNRITQVQGLSRARRLDSLSLREQRSDGGLDLGFLAAACEVRKLFLSGNYLGGFVPEVDFLNLQLLELANCGLESMPENLGQQMPNLRTLNVNFNALSDLSPLRYIPRLKKLLAAGNRLADSTAATELLTDFPHLSQLDVRDNPITMGFYAPLQVLVPATEEGGGGIDPFVLPDADPGRDEAFARRLDQATRQRRRLHQVVFAASCERLRKLDGLCIRRQDVLARDDILGALVAEGLLPAAPAETAGETEVGVPS